ncbi:MAG: hypothetical protein A2V83_02370 [Nitrospirae bacterium RBG_16_64_22]|nr:MAG: hypothetical protein A2V83_02370 [Nitrospirae bacterium RBG_16_64_22]
MKRAKRSDIAAWVDASSYDMQTARSLLKSRRYIYVLFMCQQALEKLLKAHVTKRTGTLPPRIHNLVRLGELAGVDSCREDMAFLERLSLYYIQGRYPPEIQVLAKAVTRSVAAEHLERTEAVWEKLRRPLTRNK